MNNNDRIEELLRKAPRPHAPEHLRARLREEIHLPRNIHASEDATTTPAKILRLRVKKWTWASAASIAAAAAALALTYAFISPAPVAYSFEKTIESLRTVTGFHIVHKFRHGPPQPLPSSEGAEGTTSAHPANPFVESETVTTIADGRFMSYSRSGAGSESIRNGPLGLNIDHETGDRKFFLKAVEDMTGLEDLTDWFTSLAEEARAGNVTYEVSPRPNAEGNLKVVIHHLAFGPDERLVMWVDASTHLPVRAQMLSNAFPEYGSDVRMQEWEYTPIDTIDPALFPIDPTDEELAYFGLTRADLDDLPLSTTSIEIGGEEGMRVIGTISDDRGSREIAGTLPMVLTEAPRGTMRIDLRLENEERHTFRVNVGAGEMAGTGHRIVVRLTEDGRETRITTGPLGWND